MKKGVSTPTRGRPRAFDPEKALDQAMRVFWKFGYEGASLPVLTKAMGINRPSMYAAFGNKEALFRAVMDRYEKLTQGLLKLAMSEPTARESVRALLSGAIGNSAFGRSRGCLYVQAALSCTDSSDCIRRELASRRSSVEKALVARFQRAALEGDLPKNAEPPALAKFYATLLHGMAVQLASGADRDQLHKALDVALSVFPKRPS